MKKVIFIHFFALALTCTGKMLSVLDKTKETKTEKMNKIENVCDKNDTILSLIQGSERRVPFTQ